jgi:hypothetical protein
MECSRSGNPLHGRLFAVLAAILPLRYQAVKILVNAEAPTAGMAVRGFPTTFGSLRVLFCCQTDQHHSK